MESPTALLKAIQQFCESIDQAHPYLSEPLRDLTRDLSIAVNAYMGVEVTVFADLGMPITLTSFGDGTDVEQIRTSLRLPLAALRTGSSTGYVTFYAQRAGVFVDLAADLTFVLARGLTDTAGSPTSIRLDEHLTPTNDQSALTGVTEASLISRAVGVLVGWGQLPEEAEAELVLGAQGASVGVVDYAHEVLHRRR